MTCDSCDFSCGNPADLQNHWRNSQNCKRSTCIFCGKKFNGVNWKVNLKTHIKHIHENVRYNCDFCGKDYAGDSSIRSHMNRKHPNEKIPEKFTLKQLPFSKIREIKPPKVQDEFDQDELIQDESDQDEPDHDEPIHDESDQDESLQDEPIQDEPIQAETIQDKLPNQKDENNEQINMTNIKKVENDQLVHQKRNSKRLYKFTKEQLSILRNFYAKNSYPENMEREILANTIGATITQVKNWFSYMRGNNSKNLVKNNKSSCTLCGKPFGGALHRRKLKKHIAKSHNQNIESENTRFKKSCESEIILTKELPNSETKLIEDEQNNDFNIQNIETISTFSGISKVSSNQCPTAEIIPSSNSNFHDFPKQFKKSKQEEDILCDKCRSDIKFSTENYNGRLCFECLDTWVNDVIEENKELVQCEFCHYKNVQPDIYIHIDKNHYDNIVVKSNKIQADFEEPIDDNIVAKSNKIQRTEITESIDDMNEKENFGGKDLEKKKNSCNFTEKIEHNNPPKRTMKVKDEFKIKSENNEDNANMEFASSKKVKKSKNNESKIEQPGKYIETANDIKSKKKNNKDLHITYVKKEHLPNTKVQITLCGVNRHTEIIRIKIRKIPNTVTLADIKQHLMSQPEKYGIFGNRNCEYQVQTAVNVDGIAIYEEYDEDEEMDFLPLFDNMIVLKCWI